MNKSLHKKNQNIVYKTEVFKQSNHMCCFSLADQVAILKGYIVSTERNWTKSISHYAIEMFSYTW